MLGSLAGKLTSRGWLSNRATRERATLCATASIDDVDDAVVVEVYEATIGTPTIDCGFRAQTQVTRQVVMERESGWENRGRTGLR